MSKKKKKQATSSFIEEMGLEDNELAVAIGDVGAMLGMCATLTNGKTIADVRGKYKPKSALGARIQEIVERAVADAKAKREAKQP